MSGPPSVAVPGLDLCPPGAAPAPEPDSLEEAVAAGAKPQKADAALGPRPPIRQVFPAFKWWDVLLLITLPGAALGFLIAGVLARSPYWLFDGLAFALTFSLICRVLLVRAADESSQSRRRLMCGAIWQIAVCIAVIDIGILISALVLLDEVMSPYAPEKFGRFGRVGGSYIFCSIGSATGNIFTAVRFRIHARSL